ncbi:hypothetical protein [Thermomonospora catenispora]|nr:hypothetical protein [Thermomonospora catenispora]
MHHRVRHTGDPDDALSELVQAPATRKGQAPHDILDTRGEPG